MKQKGFTMIELMIVAAIVAILAALAIPAYQEYTIRARVSEGFALAETAKLAVSEFAVAHNVLPARQADTGYVSPAPTSNVDSIAIANNTGVITITYGPAVAADGANTIIMTPTLNLNEDVTWVCTGGTLLFKYRPASCRP